MSICKCMRASEYMYVLLGCRTVAICCFIRQLWYSIACTHMPPPQQPTNKRSHSIDLFLIVIKCRMDLHCAQALIAQHQQHFYHSGAGAGHTNTLTFLTFPI